MSRKKRVLFLSEAAYLSTGYATYSREVLSRLQKSGKYEIAELSVYGGVKDERRKSIPWRNYPNLPSNEEEHKFYGSNPTNQFGAWRFERACLDFKVDCVISIRDYWMDSFIKSSPFRRLFSWGWMPTVDGAPQNTDWVSTFADCDGLFSYSKFGYDQLKYQGDHTLKLRGVASPAASSDFSMGDKRKARDLLGINPEHRIIGTVMRNQRRKLYPDLFKAFGKFIRETQNTDVFLYCHTGYPDNGWDIPQLLIEAGITSRTYFTYKCKCGAFGAFKFSDVVQQCPHCKNFSLCTTNVNDGLSVKELAVVYQTFDLYAQPVTCEGFGIPCVEAAACGIPITCTNYSATADFVDTLGAIPINPKAMYNELETGCDRAVLDSNDLSQIFSDFFLLPEEMRNIKGRDTRLLFEKNYNWDHTAKLWADFIDECKYADWAIPPAIKANQNQLPKLVNNSQLINWAFSASTVDGRVFDSHETLSLLKDLNFGMMKRGTCGFFVPESSIFDGENYAPMNAEILLGLVNNRINFNNHWEKARVGAITLKDEEWLHA